MGIVVCLPLSPAQAIKLMKASATGPGAALDDSIQEPPMHQPSPVAVPTPFKETVLTPKKPPSMTMVQNLMPKELKESPMPLAPKEPGPLHQPSPKELPKEPALAEPNYKAPPAKAPQEPKAPPPKPVHIYPDDRPKAPLIVKAAPPELAYKF
jgi:hypothetical protein